ncbi:FixG Ig-like domain-containing protein [Streptomyces sp. NPDC048172]|uniref:COG1470 family protein n=1 Tax=Streptomyces sp. NPDC048172 TaxID=3365505 RepID=UPI00371AC5C1
MKGRSLVVALSSLLLVLLGGGGATAASADRGDTWSAAPSGGSGGARSYFYLEGPPGTVLDDTLALTNEGDEPRTFRVRGEGEARWIVPARKRITVPPRTRAEVPFRVTVPSGAVPGDHPSALTVREDGERGKRAVRLHLRVSGPTLAALSVEDVSVRDAGGGDGGAEIAYTLVNRGNTTLRPRLAVSADGLFGALPLRAARTLPVEVPPGERVTRHERWTDPPGADRATVRLRVTAAGGAADTASATYTAVPWGGLAGIGALLALGLSGAVWYVHRTRQRQRDDGPGEEGTRAGERHGAPRELTGAVK